ncbi:MAG: hypothetical protein Q8P51_12775 [Ignavibacteria bacterium]|nr:hypothetical protein [Ignavibacteria bacterium]
MHPIKIRHAFLIAIAASLLGCAKPQQTLTPADEKIVPIYAELLLLGEEFKSPRSSLDSAAFQREMQSILSKNGMTKDELSDRLKTLAQSQELFSQFQTRVHSELEQRKPKQSP